MLSALKELTPLAKQWFGDHAMLSLELESTKIWLSEIKEYINKMIQSEINFCTLLDLINSYNAVQTFIYANFVYPKASIDSKYQNMITEINKIVSDPNNTRSMAEIVTDYATEKGISIPDEILDSLNQNRIKKFQNWFSKLTAQAFYEIYPGWYRTELSYVIDHLSKQLEVFNNELMGYYNIVISTLLEEGLSESDFDEKSVLELIKNNLKSKNAECKRFADFYRQFYKEKNSWNICPKCTQRDLSGITLLEKYSNYVDNIPSNTNLPPSVSGTRKLREDVELGKEISDIFSPKMFRSRHGLSSAKPMHLGQMGGFTFTINDLNRDQCEKKAQYVIKEKLSRGIQGVVRKVCVDDDCDRFVVKVYFKDGEEDFINEVETMKYIKSQNAGIDIPKIHDAWKCKNKFYIVMDNLSGDTLHNMVDYGEAEEEDLRKLARNVVKLHNLPDGNGVKHNDLHLRNVMWNYEDERFYIVDFGKSVKYTPLSENERINNTFEDQIELYKEVAVYDPEMSDILANEWGEPFETLSINYFA